MDYERFALILDSQASDLGRAAVRLLELGIDVLYAMDVDEAALLAQQEAERLGAVLTPAHFEPDFIDRLVSRVCIHLAAGPRSLVTVGLEPDARFVERLRDHGTEWCLWEPYTERELRFVMTAAMSTSHDGERRKDARIPTEIPTTVFMGRHRKEVTVHDLSLGGAYLATPHPFLEDSVLSLEIPLEGGTVLHGKAIVVNAKTADKPGRADVPEGMGVIFSDFTDTAQQILRDYVSGWIGRLRL